MTSAQSVDYCSNGELLLLKVDWSSPHKTWEVRCLKIFDVEHHSLETKIEKLYAALRYFHNLHEKMNAEIKKLDVEIDKLNKGSFDSVLLTENQQARSMLEDRRQKASSSMEVILGVLSTAEDEVDKACQLKMMSFEPRKRGAWSYLKKQAGALVAKNSEQEERKYFCEGPAEESKRSCKYFEPSLYQLSTTLGGWWTKSRGQAGSCRSKRKMNLIRATYDESFNALLETQSRFVFLEKKKIQYSLTVEEEREKALLSHSLKPLAVQFYDKIATIREIAEATASLGIVNQEIANCSDERQGRICDQTKTSNLILKKKELEDKVSKLTQSSLSKLLKSKKTWVVLLLACAILVFYLGSVAALASGVHSAGSFAVSGVYSTGSYVGSAASGAYSAAGGSVAWLTGWMSYLWESLTSWVCGGDPIQTMQIQSATTHLGSYFSFGFIIQWLSRRFSDLRGICTIGSSLGSWFASTSSSTESSSPPLETTTTASSSTVSSSTESSSSTPSTSDAQIPQETRQQESLKQQQTPPQRIKPTQKMQQNQKSPNVQKQNQKPFTPIVRELGKQRIERR